MDVAKACVSHGDIQQFINLGLGWGIDAADTAPWQHKTIFRVQPVTVDNITGTEEGGGECTYEREITNASEAHGQARASITDPKQTFSIGVEGEYSHSTSSKYRVVGTKVLNCTISFKAHCDDTDIDPTKDVLTFEK